tara:strand:+ start:234 stop:473 length:240 start_codon:yes stop_codon:yes gene_type:complete
MIVTGYKFLTIEDFNTSSSLLNTHYGIPVNDTDTTQNWIAYSTSYTLTNDIDFYFWVGNESIVLGAPTDFEVREQIEVN